MTETVNSLEFATAARALGAASRGLGLVAPTFCSPPRVPGAERTLRRARSGWTTVSIRLDHRPLGAVVADMVEGVIAANRLTGAESTRVRTSLWEAVSTSLSSGLVSNLAGNVSGDVPANTAVGQPDMATRQTLDSHAANASRSRHAA